MDRLFDFEDYGALLGLVHNSLIAAALLGVVGGLVGVFVQARDMQFAVHGISELSFAGAAAALLLGGSVALGSVVGSLLAAGLHLRQAKLQRGRDAPDAIAHAAREVDRRRFLEVFRGAAHLRDDFAEPEDLRQHLIVEHEIIGVF